MLATPGLIAQVAAGGSRETCVWEALPRAAWVVLCCSHARPRPRPRPQVRLPNAPPCFLCRRGEPGPQVHPAGPLQPVQQVQERRVTHGDVPALPTSPPSPCCPHLPGLSPRPPARVCELQGSEASLLWAPG